MNRTARSRVGFAAAIISALAVTAVFGYFALANYYDSLEPNPKFDRFAAITAALPACEPEQSAWYAYMDAMHPRHLGSDDSTVVNMLRSDFPIDAALRARLEESGHLVWDDDFSAAFDTARHALDSRGGATNAAVRQLVGELLAHFAPTREALVKASKVPVFCVRTPPADDPRTAEFLERSALFLMFDEVPQAEIGYRESRFLHSVSEILEIDAEWALAAGDAERALVDLETIARMARHCDEVGSVFRQLTARGISAKAWFLLNRCLSLYPSLWTDEQLTRFEAVLVAMDEHGVELDLTVDRAFVEAFVSQYYSDDGAGDGVLLFKTLITSTRGDPRIGRLAKWGPAGVLSAPWFIWRAPTRAELMRDHEAHLKGIRERMATPLWKRSRAALARIGTEPPLRPDTDPVGMVAFFPLNRMADTFAWTAHRDGARLAFVIERFRRAQGALPATMDELLAFARERGLEGPPAPWGLAPLTTDTQSGRPYRLRIVTLENGAEGVEIWSDGPDDPDLAAEIDVAAEGYRVVPPHLRRWERE